MRPVICECDVLDHVDVGFAYQTIDRLADLNIIQTGATCATIPGTEACAKLGK
jgi:hypothetical protein